MVSKRNSSTEIGLQEWSGFFDELKSESERGAAILASVWIESLLERKLRIQFAKGNSETRRKLFDLNGPFSAFSSKTLVAHALGWIDSEVFHDINLVRKIRNVFAHELHGTDFDYPKVSRLIDKFTVPERYYHDWDELQAAETKDGKGAVLYMGDRPDDAGDGLSVQKLRYKISVSILVAEVAQSLDLTILIPKSAIDINPE